MALIVEALAPGATRNLFELAHLEAADLATVELGELGEEHGAERDIDADAEGVGAGDHLEEALLGELLHLQPVLGKEAGVVDADAEAEEALELLAVGGEEAGVADGLANRGLLLLCGELHAGEFLSHLGAIPLGEVDQIDRRLVRLHQPLDGFVEGCLVIAEVERHRAFVRLNQCGGAACPVLDVAHDAAHVAEGGRHEQEAGVGEGDQRYLPRPPPVAVGVVVELVHYHVRGVEVLALSQGEVGQHLGRAANHGSVGRVDAGVAGQACPRCRRRSRSTGRRTSRSPAP